MKTVCFYHNADLDGICSGAIVNLKFDAVELIGVDYGDPVPWERLKEMEKNLKPVSDEDYERLRVVIVDFSFDMEDMARLEREYHLIWIDHHKTAIAAAKDAGLEDVGGLRVVGKAGCELTWWYFYAGEMMPKAVHLLGRYDVWDKTDPDVDAFQYGMRLVQIPVDDKEAWQMLFNFYPNRHGHETLVDQWIVRGRTVLAFEQQQARRYAQSYGMVVELDGHIYAALNRGNASSMALDGFYDPMKHDAMMLFCRGPKGWKVSLYSDKKFVDVSETAVKFGGGGHAGAAGFLCDVLPFEFSGGCHG